MTITSIFRRFQKPRPIARRLTVCLSVETLEGRVVPALTAVASTLQTPYSAVVALEMTFPNGRSYVGTGTLIDANSVLTAGHTMYSQADGGWATKMTVWAGYNNGAYVAKTTAIQFAVDQRYINHEIAYDQAGDNYSEDGDIGIVTLKDAIGTIAGTFKIERADSTINFQNAVLSSLSYPADSPYNGEVQYLSSGAISTYAADGSTKLLVWNNHYGNDSTGLTLVYGGQSGAPLFRVANGQYLVDAVFTAATNLPSSRGYAVLLTDGVYNELSAWRAQDDTAVFSSGTNQYALPDPHVTVARKITHSNESYARTIAAAYSTYLGRSPDPGGLNDWVVKMSQGLSDERLEVGFIGSAEYIAQHGGGGELWVRGMYDDLLGRDADDAGLQSWLRALAGGTKPETIAYGFAASAEREGQRITADYTTYLGRGPEPGAVNSWVAAFLSGVSNEDVIAGFVGSKEYYASHGSDDTAWLRAVYHDVLARSPSQFEINAWLAVLS